jgi:hypothetical protein
VGFNEVKTPLEVTMQNPIDTVVAEMQASLPPIFAGKSLDNLTGEAIVWASVQNARSRHEVPEECFIYSGRKVLVRRDSFLSWWRSTLRESSGYAKQRIGHGA